MSDYESLNIATKKHVWKFYVKLTNFKAQCMFCEIKYVYINDIHFRIHLAKHHSKVWKYEEERKLIKWPWRYFKYFNELYSQCIICDTTVLSTTESVENHLSSHSLQQLENNIYRRWTLKYLTEREDFEVECDICHKNISIGIVKTLNSHTKMTHPDKIRNAQETHNTVGSLKRVLSLQTDTTIMPLTIVTKEHLWEYYVKLPDFKAQCRFCKNNYYYITHSSFNTHITKNHKDIWKYEEERKLTKRIWMHFRYLNNIYSQCIICNATVLSITASVENHLSSHSSQELEKNIYRGRAQKYCIQKDDFMVECNVCNKNISLSVASSLDYHIKMTHPDKVKNTQETYDTECSPKRVLSLQTDTMTKSLSIATKKHLWKYYVKLSNFKAQCIFCKNTYVYVQYSSFKNHITKIHKEVWKYEKEKKQTKCPWIYFKYLNELYLQCIICNANVLYLSESVESHLSSHSEKQRKNHILYNWAWKYCTQKDDFMVECCICNNNISLSISSNVDYHIKMVHSDKVKSTQETYDTVRLSKRVSLLQTDTTSNLILSLKDCYVLLKKCPHDDLYM